MAVQLALSGQVLSHVWLPGLKLYWLAGHLLQVSFWPPPVTSPNVQFLTCTVILVELTESCRYQILQLHAAYCMSCVQQ